MIEALWKKIEKDIRGGVPVKREQRRRKHTQPALRGDNVKMMPRQMFGTDSDAKYRKDRDWQMSGGQVVQIQILPAQAALL